MSEEFIKNIRYPIRLGQLLKHLEIAQDGIESKMLIQSGSVYVNGAVETRRGKQLCSGDIISVNDAIYHLE